MVFLQIFGTKGEIYANSVGDVLSSKMCQKARFKRSNEVSKEVYYEKSRFFSNFDSFM